MSERTIERVSQTGGARVCAGCGGPIGPMRVGVLDFHPQRTGYRIVHVACIGQQLRRAS